MPNNKNNAWESFDHFAYMDISKIDLTDKFVNLLEEMLSDFNPHRKALQKVTMNGKIASMRIREKNGHVNFTKVPILYKEPNANIDSFKEQEKILNFDNGAMIVSIAETIRLNYSRYFNISVKELDHANSGIWLFTIIKTEVGEVITDFYIAEKFVNKYRNAKTRKINCTLTLPHMRKLLKRASCQITGIKFVNETEHPHSRTIERINNELGYTNENTIVIIKELNDHKANITLDEIKLLAKYIKKKGL